MASLNNWISSLYFKDPKNLNDDYMAAVARGHKEVVEKCLQLGANINGDGRCPLVSALEHGKTEILKLLVEKKADINKGNVFKSTALITAARYENEEALLFLLQNKADPNLMNKNNESPLMIAAQKGNVSMVKCLLKHNADPELRNDKGKIALDLTQSEEVVQILQGFEAEKIKDKLDRIVSTNAMPKGVTDLIAEYAIKNPNEEKQASCTIA